MNFLAHAYLAGPQAGDRAGAILGDFVKGPLPGALPAALVAGVKLHRHIDSFAERHPAFQASRRRVSAARRRYAGIMLDLFYDHFLARHWPRYGVEPLPAFAAAMYALWRVHAAPFSARLAELLPIIEAQDWLTSYRSVDAVAAALDRMSAQRLRQGNTLAGAAEELEAGYAEFERDFESFFPAACAYAAELREKRPFPAPSR